ncbi:hypothetical protein PybrP1_002228 [[Pythium] brassicae (nom. inval.)]|nr:hypothetical protein PybrP1_002228 [[Pythium] brassicae (nom. inval.)]
MSKKVAAQLKKLQGDEWDSDSDTEEAAFNSNFVKLGSATASTASGSTSAGDAKAPKKRAARKQQAAAAAAAGSSANTPASNVIYLGRIPHGFYEKQMMGFFKQFGILRRLRISRNKRTGKSKHYAFLQFEEPEVAEVVARTMDGYRLFDHTLSCHIVPAHAVHERMFVGANKTFKPVPWVALARKEHNAEKSYEQTLALNKRLVKKEKAKRKAFEALGIQYDFPGFAAQVPAKKTHIAFE